MVYNRNIMKSRKSVIFKHIFSSELLKTTLCIQMRTICFLTLLSIFDPTLFLSLLYHLIQLWNRCDAESSAGI